MTRFLSIITNKSYWLSFISGLSLVFAYAPYSLWWLPALSLPLWYSQINLTSPKQAAANSFAFGLGWFGSGISWVHVSIDEFGGLPIVATFILMLLLCSYLALFPALSGYLSARFTPNKKLSLVMLLATWTFTEWLRGWFLTGFPWLTLGYTQIDSPLRALAPITGEVGLTMIIMFISLCFYRLACRQHVLPSRIAIIAIALATIAAHQLNWVTPTGKTTNVALVQGNIAQELKWLPEQELPTMLKYLDLTRQNYQADIVVWPESAIPALEATVDEFLDIANQGAAINNTAIVTGIINYNFESREYFNSLIVLGKKQPEDTQGSYYYPNNNRYYKHHLLPIGEFVPFQEWLRPLAPLFNLPMSSFTRGSYVQQNLIANGIQIAPLICFEIAFANQLAANFSNETNLLLTVSNDAWFGTSHGPHQHMDIARMRALEFGRPLVRSTNTGVTAIVDHQGNFVEKAPQFEEVVVSSQVSLVDGLTPFSRYQHYPVFLLSLILFLAIYFRKSQL